jgi:hypothetical protein
MHPALPMPAAEFRALQSEERSYLLEWQTRVRAIGIDAVQDLAPRPWPCPIADTVIGIYKLGDELASWLVVGHAGWWAVSRRDDGSVSQSLGSLADALALVYQLGTRQLGTQQLGLRLVE